MRIDVMVDIETLGTKADSTIFQIAAIAFDIETGQHLSQFNRTADISKNDYMNVDGSTIKWWLNENKELFTNLINSGVGSSEELLEEFHSWLTGLSVVGDLHLWGNGIMFDNNMIKTQFEESVLEHPINFRNDRDVRTLVELAAIKLGTTVSEIRKRFDRGTAHDAFDDVKHQIDYVVYCFNELTGGIKNEEN